MASGKELHRTVTCGIWKRYIATLPTYREVRIYNSRGKRISAEKVRGNTFCHMRVLFQGLGGDEAKIIGVLLQVVASTSGEQMVLGINENYNLTEIVIS